MKETVRRKIWVRAGGRCCMCGEYLLDGDIGSPIPTVGEVAHNKGRRRGGPSSRPVGRSKSPRHEFLLPGEDPDDPDNLLLLCPTHHIQVDAESNAGTIDVEILRAIKSTHEKRIRQATAMVGADRTAVVRVIGDLYGESVQCSRLEATGAVLRATQRMPDFALAMDHATIECDLRGLGGEGDGSAVYFSAAIASIDELVDGRLSDGIATDKIGHISVFAFARLPVLVYLGARLGDAISSDLYQRSRLTESWEWPDVGREATFVVSAPAADDSNEVVLAVSASGTIQRHELPEHLRGLPIYELATGDGTVADANVIRTASDLKRLQAAFYEALGRIEEGHKPVEVLHLVAAAPLSAAVAMGQALNRQVFHTVSIYHRHNRTYESAVALSESRPLQ